MNNKENEMDTKNNTGKENSGYRNSGDYNSGNRNSGHYNSGHYNSGKCNSGDYNSGDRNIGDRNSGYRNSGDYNSGDYNSGYRNSGNRNSGHYNSGNRNSGLFNTDEPTVRMFNKDTNIKISEFKIPYLELPVTELVSVGTLITRTYKEAWGIAWSKSDQNKKNEFLNLPNFDADIFFEITGVDVRKSKEQTCTGKIVEIDGKKYKLTEVQSEGGV